MIMFLGLLLAIFFGIIALVMVAVDTAANETEFSLTIEEGWAMVFLIFAAICFGGQCIVWLIWFIKWVWVAV